MEGVRILEVAEHTFVPAASALLADLGADVIKIEHAQRGDAMRGLASSGTVSMGGDVHVILEHSNRGKKSLGLDLTTGEGLDILYRLAATCDVFLTNKLPSVRTKLRIDIDDLRAHNPHIIYVRGTGQGQRGWTPPPVDRPLFNPLVTNYRTKDDRWIGLCCLQAAKYWPDACRVVERPDLADDERFADTESITKNAGVASDLLAEAFV